jgi:hypothetical protein
MNKLSVEKILLKIQLALIPLALVVLLISIAFDANAASDESPSMELLEFLGEWQTKDGEWVDPMRFLTVNDSDLEHGSSLGVATKGFVKEDVEND